MKAIVHTNYGTPDVLQLREMKRPEPKPNEVLVKILAAAVNKADWFLVRGKPFPVRLMAGLFKPKNTIRGADMAGVVERVGSAVRQFRPGDEVYGDLSADGFGCFAEYVSTHEKYLAKKPATLNFEESAALPMAAVTALQGLRDAGKIKSGQSVLINGASGGVGTFAIQIAKAYGAHVTAVCSTTKVEMAKSLGADVVIDYTRENFTTQNAQYDLIFDGVLNHSLTDCCNVLKKGGRYVAVAVSLAAMLRAPLMAITQGKHVTSMLASANQADLQFICKLAEEGKLNSVIQKTFTLDDVPEALWTVGRGSTIGKLVITV